MTITLFELEDFPNRVAISKANDYQVNGTFFLDFSKPLTVIRWFGKVNDVFGIAVGLRVPVIHQSENIGGYVVSCHANEPQYKTIKQLWKNHYPTANPIVAIEVDGLNLIADFAKQFKEDA
jgi:hypothetical protein